MYKLIASWSAPSSGDAEAFEKQYWDVHIPLAAASPRMRRMVLTHTTDGLEGGASRLLSHCGARLGLEGRLRALRGVC